MNAIKLSDRYRSKEVFQKSVNVEIPSGRCILFSNELRMLKKWWRKIAEIILASLLLHTNNLLLSNAIIRKGRVW